MNFSANTQSTVQTIHGIVLTLCWVFLADAILLVTRYYKNWSKYLTFHSIMGLVNLLTIIVVVSVVVVDSSYLFNAAGFAGMSVATRAHFIFGMILLFFLLCLQVVGFLVKKDIEGTAPPSAIGNKRNLHRAFGYFVYAIIRIQILLGWLIFNGYWDWQDYFLAIYTIIFFAVKFLYFQRNYRAQNLNIYTSFANQFKAVTKGTRYDTMIEMLENGISKAKIRQEYPNVKYTLYKNKLFDVTGLTHPGGAFIIQHIIGEEISRYIHGAYGLEIDTFPAYKHTIYAERLLGEMLVSEIQYSKLDILIPKIGDKLGVPAVWTIMKATALTTNLKCFYLQSDRYKVNPQPKTVLYLGRHFIMSPASNTQLSPRLYTLTLCMSPVHKDHVKHMIKELEAPELVGGTRFSKFPMQITELPFVIKEYKVWGFSEFISSASEHQEFVVEGPFGRGLELEDGHYFGFCGGTGVLPLLDLIYEILIQLHRRVLNLKTASRLPDGFRFTLYLSLNHPEQLVGLQIIAQTFLLCEKFKQREKLFDLCLRISKGKFEAKQLPTFKERLDHDKLQSIVSNKDVHMAFVCGSPEMNRSIGNSLGKLIGTDKVHIM